jgi:Ankyrin repeats (3 copies)
MLEQSQFLTAPVPAQPLAFNLSLEEPLINEQPRSLGGPEDGDSRLAKMLASQARLRGSAADKGEEAILKSSDLSDAEKRRTLQDLFAMAASNGEVDQVKRLLTGSTKEFVDINAPDADGNLPIIYASCFGHAEVVSILVENGADIDKRDQASWNALIWAITNRQKDIVKYLLDHGASPDAKTTSGRTAFDFVAPNSDMAEYLHNWGYKIGNAGVSEDFYSSGFSQDKFEEEMAENEMRRRMMMESAVNLEVDLGNLTLDEQAEVSILDS